MGEEHALMFVRTWAEEVLRHIERVEQTRRSVDSAYRMQGDELGIEGEYLQGEFRRLWAAEHTLLWAAYQLERWRDRLDRERGDTEREPDKELKRARNVLEHLDTADFIGDEAVAPPWEPPEESKKCKPRDPYWSLRKLGGLSISITDDGTFCGIASSDLRDHARDVVHSVENELGEEAADYLAELWSER
ncbi:hypothetical protein IPZ61_11495 [Streptomyces sioyaensis]|uniref:hypothetical protein n=1 Tax=Streptomyces sioyaensis TaxID=67364 RepID=UPI001F219A56|nr:hypothetical protein [Streptomyces sioyaensis]MCF3173939.1 hypothetical protein [Streptomyces sioyaensis]